MTKHILILFYLILTDNLYSESYGIFLDSVIRGATFKDEVIIKSYKLGADNSVINIEVVKPNKPDSSFLISKFIPTDFKYGPLIYSKKAARNKDFPILFSYWPDVGERVLVILDKTSTLIFFGEIFESKYRIFTQLYNPAHGTGFYSKYSLEAVDTKHKHKNGDNYLYLGSVFITKLDLQTKWVDRG